MTIHELLTDVEQEEARRTSGHWIPEDADAEAIGEFLGEALGFDVRALHDLCREVIALRGELEALKRR